MNFTSDQQDAVYSYDRNVIVVAGAGSGKTHVLISRYLALLDANPDWPLNALVAITFTKKAAEEMRDRIRQELEDRLNNARDQADVDRWTALFSQLDAARVDTIHGLCADLLRANAAEAGIDPDFVVMDETDAAILLEDTVDYVLADLVVSDDPAVELLAELDIRAIREVLTDANLLTAPIDDLPADPLSHWRSIWQEEARQAIPAFLHRADSIGTFDPVSGDLIGEGWQQCLTCLDYLHSNSELEPCLEALHIIASISMSGGSAKKWADAQTLKAAKAALTAIRNLARATLEQIGEQPGGLDERAAYLLPQWASLIRQVKQAYDWVKRQQSLLDFIDLELLTCDLLADHSHVRERYCGREFRHLLVDEFQDTNAAQWQIVQMLGGLDKPGSMFVVGDQKQSIYAFRGADVSVFGDVRAQITGTGGREIPLAMSFRSHQPLIACFNEVFDRILVPDYNSPVAAYQVDLDTPMEAFRKESPAETAIVEFILLDQHERDDDSNIRVVMKNDRSSKLRRPAEECRKWEAREIARRVQEMVREEQPVYDRETGQNRPVEYGDVAILFQSFSNVNLYEEVFKAMGLPFVTAAGRGYYNRQEVWDMLNLLQAVYNPADNLSLAAALRSPLFGLSDDALLALRLDQGGDDAQSLSLWEALAHPGSLLPPDEQERVAFAHICLNELRAAAGRVTISELLRDALERTGYLAVLSGLPDGARRRGNIEKLLEKARSSGKITLGAFSQYLRDLSQRETREGEAVVDSTGAVTIMTVHGSKGLEFPVVVLADSSWTRGNVGQPPLLFDQQHGLACKVSDDDGELKATFAYNQIRQLADMRGDAERLRLLYVAATRAQDYLIICGQAAEDDKGGWKTGGWLDILLEALELRHRLNPCDDNLHTYSWGQARVRLPRWNPPADMDRSRAAAQAVNWTLAPPTSDAATPPLLTRIHFQPESRARHLAATHIIDLGSAQQANNPREKDLSKQRFLRQLFHDAPNHVESVTPKNGHPVVTQRKIGEIVHEALRHWHLLETGSDDYLREMLRVYAWRQGITAEADSRRAVERAYKLLNKFRQSDLYRWLAYASEVYRELPFIHERDGCIVHGVIDVLLRTSDGQWVIVDYKTSAVQGESGDRYTLHARRYHLQLGVYASAVQAQLGGIIPETYVHYIRDMHTVRIHEIDWQAALARSIPEQVRVLIEDNAR
jgi:ATP-dependent helicase/nuclease subunit A